MSRKETKLQILDNEDFGSEKLNNFYKKLDKSVKKKIIDMNKESAIQLLEIMSNPNIQDVYDGLTQQEKDKLKKSGLVQKYTTLKEMLDKKVKETTFVLETNQTNQINGPKTPEGTPPPLTIIQEKETQEEKEDQEKDEKKEKRLQEIKYLIFNQKEFKK
jgi:hypothetical protein